MRRREFLMNSVAGALGPAFAWAAQPCPPPSVSVSGGNSATSSCGPTSGGAEADWISRSTGPGVKWAHDFRDPSEFSRFAYFLPGQSQAMLQHSTADGIGSGACVEFNVPAGAHCNHSWLRPFSAFPGDIGYAGGPSYGSSSDWYKWRQGFYGHRDYHASSPGAFVGTDFYLQMRLKFSRSYFSSKNPPGKLFYIDIAGGGNQEIIVQGPIGPGLYAMYTNFGRAHSNPLGQPQGDRTAYSTVYPTTIMQPGAAYNDTCRYETHNAANCWTYPVEEWVTILIHVIPGHHSGTNGSINTADLYGSPGANKDTGIEVWGARQGQTTYTKIWDKRDYVWNYGATSAIYGDQFGFNMLVYSAYKNGVVAGDAWWCRLGQVIFATQPIPCPVV